MRELRALAARKRTAIMCAGALWWRCHRALISDVLKADGWKVLHILDATSSSEHPYSSPARIIDGRLPYPAEHLAFEEGTATWNSQAASGRLKAASFGLHGVIRQHRLQLEAGSSALAARSLVVLCDS